YAARDIENSKRDNPEKPAVEPELTLDDYAARDMENSKRDNPETSTDAAPAAPTEASESKEVLSENYEREKIEQREGREDEKLSDVSSGNRDQWSTIDNGKTDGTGKPFVYKEGTRTIDGQEQRVLLAYSPNGGVQVMDINTHEWKFMNQMTPDEQKQIGGAEGMDAEARDAALAAEQKEDPDAFRKRMDQNGRNLTMEEDCLKDSKANSEWFKS
ncbi:MAG: hypothetical protein KBC47_02745, partial [Candidatus Peribacteraceae bacterium]|nr:hypothetical protein [Candidatus Peribacteraceae bacterium]